MSQSQGLHRSSGLWLSRFKDDPNMQILAVRLYYQMQNTADDVVGALRRLALRYYVPHANAPTKRQRGSPAHTTWDAIALSRKTTADTCDWIAESIYREKLDQLLYGTPHWSHVEYTRAGRTGGEVDAG